MPRGLTTKVEKTRRKSELTVKQLRFILGIFDEQLTSTDAYLKYVALSPELDRKSAGDAASRLLARPEIRKYMREVQEHELQTAAVTFNRLVHTSAAIAFADRTKMFNEDGSIKPPHEWPRDLQIACDGVEIEEKDGWVEGEDGEMVRGVVGRKIRVKMGGSKLKACELLMKLKKMLDKDNVEERQARAAAAHPPLVVVLEPDKPPVSQEPEPGEE